MSKSPKNRYSELVSYVFNSKYTDGAKKIEFLRSDLEDAARVLGIILPKNLGDIIYSFKFRTAFPETILKSTSDNLEWVIKNIGRSRYAFVLVPFSRIIPDNMLITIKIPDSTPSIVSKYSFEDEQSLLAKLRYNRLLDIFTGVTCYSLQNHLRTTVPGIGQIETDEIYVGLDKSGLQYVFPIQAKGGNDELGVVQIEQDIRLCKFKYPDLECRSIAAQFIDSNVIVMFEFTLQNGDVKKVAESRYQLVDAADITKAELEEYRRMHNPVSSSF